MEKKGDPPYRKNMKREVYLVGGQARQSGCEGGEQKDKTFESDVGKCILTPGRRSCFGQKLAESEVLGTVPERRQGGGR